MRCNFKLKPAQFWKYFQHTEQEISAILEQRFSTKGQATITRRPREKDLLMGIISNSGRANGCSQVVTVLCSPSSLLLVNFSNTVRQEHEVVVLHVGYSLFATSLIHG